MSDLTKTDLIKMHLLDDNVLVLPKPGEPTTPSGVILLPGADRGNKSIVATVILTGPGFTDQPPVVKQGDTVVVPKFGGRELIVDLEDGNPPATMLLCRMDAVLAIVDEFAQQGA